MATNYSPLLGLALPTQGELSGTWGDTVNNGITSLLDSAVAGTTTLSTDADVTLTTSTGAANQARAAILLYSGAKTALRTITAPAASKAYLVINSSTGGFGMKLVGVGPTTGVTVAAGTRALVAWSGSDFVVVSTSPVNLATDITGTLAVTNGGTGGTSVATAQTALQVPSITTVQNSASQVLGSVAGTNTITGSLTPAITAYATGQTFRFTAAGANTGATTININSLGAKAITKSGATALAAGDIPSGAAVQIQYDGTQFQLSSGAGGGNGATNQLTQSNIDVLAGTGRSLVGPITITGTATISGRLVIL